MPKAATPTLGESEHVVQFYESDAFLIESVCGFISSALAAGVGVLVCITDAHQQLIETAMAARGMDLRLARERGQYVVLPTASALAKVIRDGLPDPERFENVVGETVSWLAQTWPRVKAFGEFVAVFRDEGNHEFKPETQF